jgi:hypothetical protein
MIHEDIALFANDIRDFLERYVNGGIKDNEAKELFKTFEERYRELKLEPVSLDHQNALGGLCYYHSVENFSLLTGIFEICAGKVNSVAYHGDDIINKHILKEIENHLDVLEEKDYLRIEPGNGELKTALHLYPFKECQSALFITASLSSSPYFNMKRFIYFGNFLNTLYPDDKKTVHGVIDIFRAIERYINNNVDRFDLYTQIYCFQDIDKIFNHAGTQTLFDVSTSIEKQIAEAWGEHLPRFTISLKEYTVIIAKERGIPVSETSRKIDFNYNGIPLPHTYGLIKIEGPGAFFQFTEKLFSLSEQ